MEIRVTPVLGGTKYAVYAPITPDVYTLAWTFPTEEQALNMKARMEATEATKIK